MFCFFGNIGSASNFYSSRNSIVYTDDATIDISNKNIFLDASSNDITLTMISAVGNETLEFIIKRIDDSNNIVNIVPAGADYIAKAGDSARIDCTTGECETVITHGDYFILFAAGLDNPTTGIGIVSFEEEL